MADQMPGQVISPNQGPDEPHDQPSHEETSLKIAHDPAPVPAEPAMAVPPIAESPQVQPPAPAEPDMAAQPEPIQPPEPISQPPVSIPAEPVVFTAEPTPQSVASADKDEFTPYAAEGVQEFEPAEDAGVSWTASEYVAHHKSTGWYALLALATVAIVVGVYFINHGDIVSVVVVIMVAILFGFYAARVPKEQQFSVSDQGVTIGLKNYGFNEFRSFIVTEEGAFSSITFMPLKRFMPAISIYYDPKDEDAIAEILSRHLPFEDGGHDMIERLMRRLRF